MLQEAQIDHLATFIIFIPRLKHKKYPQPTKTWVYLGIRPNFKVTDYLKADSYFNLIIYKKPTNARI